MTRHVSFRPEAASEVFEAWQWYDGRRPGLGEEFADAVSGIISRIVDRPLMFPRANGEIRRAVLQRFPYAVYFRLVGTMSSCLPCKVANIRHGGSCGRDRFGI